MKKVSASENQGAFMISDIQIKEEAFLEDICSILNMGEIPNLFNAEEKNEILEIMRTIDRAKDKSLQSDGSPVTLFNMFLTVSFNFICLHFMYNIALLTFNFNFNFI
jgi:dynein heavy chain